MFTIYESDILRTCFEWQDECKTEQEAKLKAAYLAGLGSEPESCYYNKDFIVFVFRGKSNLNGKMVQSITVKNYNK
jgi:hypothetical protein